MTRLLSILKFEGSEVFRVLKHGGHLLSFGGCRTAHRMTVAIEDAGFIIRGMLGWAFSSGMPKSHNISLFIDKKKGLQGQRGKGGLDKFSGQAGQEMRKAKLYKNQEIEAIENFTPKSEEAKKWEGWGTDLAPAFEPICMAMKPLKYKTYAENMVMLGTGGLNIDACRVEAEDMEKLEATRNSFEKYYNRDDVNKKSFFQGGKKRIAKHNVGRFPKNVLLEKTEEINKLFPISKSQKRNPNHNKENSIKDDSYTPKKAIYNDDNSYSDTGSNARMYSQFEMTEEDYFYQNQALIDKYYRPFYYCPKTNKKEADAGIKNKTNVTIQGNFHPTKKPVELCSWLVMLITQPKGTVLDPFMGTAPVGIACHKNGFDYIGIEKEKEYFDLAEQRIENEKNNLSLPL